jgi:hypothetical protein
MASSAAQTGDGLPSQGIPAEGLPMEPGSQGLRPDQALALLGLGLVQRLESAAEAPWVWNEADDGGRADLRALRHRLELVQLALNTGAPLSTAEVTALLGARPTAAEIERGGLRARRLSRNVWSLSRVEHGQGRRAEVTSFSGFNDGRRRFA